MTDFADDDLSGSTFHRVDLSRARFEEVDLSGAWARNVYLVDTTLRGAWLENVDVDGEIRGLTINGVDVGPLVEAELDRRDPDRILVREARESADAMRTAWAMVQRRWTDTVERARRLPEPLLHERVADEYSFLETLRHLVFATDAWVLRAYLGQPAPWSPLGVTHSEMDEHSVPLDTEADPGLDEVLALRADRVATVTRVLEELSDDDLAATTEPVLAPGYPESEAFAVRRCLGAVVSEEWHHRLFAERDLAVLEASRDQRASPSTPNV